MLDIKFIRENPERVQKAAKDKNIDVDIQHVLEIDTKYRELLQTVQKLREGRNNLLEEIKGKPSDEQIKKGQELKQKIEKEDHALKAVEEELHEWLFKIPNPAKPDVKVGKDEAENEIIRKYKQPSEFNFTPKDHLELGELLDIIDVKRTSKVSGARFAYLKNEAVLLEFALVQLALEILIKEGFTPVVPPVLIRQNITEGLSYWQGGGHNDYYLVYDPVCTKCNRELSLGLTKCSYCGYKIDPNEYPGFYLVGTAEHSIVPMHKDEILQKNELPKRYVGFSTAFRREAGSYGKDTRGILRVHQFDKVEMVSFVEEGQDDKEHEYLLSLEEKFFQMLDIPYQVVKMCTGDLGFPAARKYDIEAWMPGQQKYREVTSVSTVTDFQSRRLNIKYQDGPSAGGEKKYVSILNGTAFAIGRTIIAILENYQNQNGSVTIPEVLRKYLNKSVIEPHK